MPKTYDVIVTRDTTESCILTIEAESPEEARYAALARSNQDLDVAWEQDDTTNASKRHYVTSCEDIEVSTA